MTGSMNNSGGAADGSAGGNQNSQDGSNNPSGGGADQGAGGAGGDPAPWFKAAGYESLDAEDQDWLGAKKYKGAPDVVKALRAAEKKIRAPQERVAILPEKLDNDAELMPIFDRLGRPAKADEYVLPKIDGVPLDEARIGKFREIAHQHGVTSRQFENMVKFQAMAEVEMVKAQDQQIADAVKAEDSALRQEWGQKYDEKIAKGKQIAAALGYDTAKLGQLEGLMGYSGLLKLFATFGDKVGEDTLITSAKGGDGAGAYTTIEQVEARLEEIRNDDDMRKKYLEGDPAVTAELRNLEAKRRELATRRT